MKAFCTAAGARSGDEFAGELSIVGTKAEGTVLLRSQLGLHGLTSGASMVSMSRIGGFLLGLAGIGIRIHVGTLQK